MLAVLASQALHVTDRHPPTALRPILDQVRAIVPPVDADRVLGPELARLAAQFTSQAFSAEER
jgi:histidine ammonia-lyase